MSILNRTPSTMQKIRWNFKGKEGEISSDERYVQDMRQFDNGEWNLNDYVGAAYGLQYQLDDSKWGTHGDIYLLSKQFSDKRIDGAISRPDLCFIGPEVDEERGKYFALRINQQARDETPGAIGCNGWWYADEVGPENMYRIKCTLEAKEDFEHTALLGCYVLGYKYGYLDGPRKEYMIIVDHFEPNEKRSFDETFYVDPNYRHVVMNYMVWQKGGVNREAESEGWVYDVTVERT